jgi:hypothetical protein
LSVAAVLQPRCLCPHCWHYFSIEDTHWIAEHGGLIGDAVLGKQEQRRFLPSHFDAVGNAIDARGDRCFRLACPRCHLQIPRAALELESLVVSIFGAPASGKSYFLAAAANELRRILPGDFHVEFADAEPMLNQHLLDSEAAVFSSSAPGKRVPLNQLVNKTALDGDVYNSINLGGQIVRYVRPMMFTLRPRKRHSNFAEAHRHSRLLCLYDNAGEHFQPGADTSAAPVTRHMAHSRFLLFVFDPTQEPRFRAKFRNEFPGDREKFRPQAPILQEAATRIRRYANLPTGALHDRPLIVVLTKSDLWGTRLPGAELFRPIIDVPQVGTAVDLDAVAQQSTELRRLLLETCPDIVHTAEGFCETVVYCAASALGRCVEYEDGQGFVAPEAIRPQHVAVPFLYGMAKWSKGLTPGVHRKTPKTAATIGRIIRE